MRVRWLVGGLLCAALLAGCGGPGATTTPPEAVRRPTPTPTPTPTPRPGKWRLVPNPATSASDNSRLAGVAAFSPTDVWAVGGIYLAQISSNSPLVLHYDGHQWSMMPSPSANAGNLTALAATSSKEMWAVGNYNPATNSQPLFMHYDGQQWTLVPGPDTGENSGLNGVSASAPNDVWAVGFSQVSASPHMDPLVEHFDGTRWQIVPTADLGSGGGSLQSVAAIAPDDVWAVGRTPNAQMGGWNPLIEHYDGARWSVVSGAVGGSAFLASVVATSSDDVWIVGRSISTGDGPVPQYDGLVEHYDGTRWTVVPTAKLSYPASSFSVVAAASPTDVWVGGSAPVELSATGGDTRVITEHWDGTQWKAAAAPSTAPYTNDLAGIAFLSPSDAWAVGSSVFSQQGPVQATTLHYTP